MKFINVTPAQAFREIEEVLNVPLSADVLDSLAARFALLYEFKSNEEHEEIIDALTKSFETDRAEMSATIDTLRRELGAFKDRLDYEQNTTARLRENNKELEESYKELVENNKALQKQYVFAWLDNYGTDAFKAEVIKQRGTFTPAGCVIVLRSFIGQRVGLIAARDVMKRVYFEDTLTR